ncbi:MAG: type II secretion system protein GspN [Rickettsiales bacterium]|nr:type II secretion system protein GspN [Rickettsiales bacterium]|tara:strand:- start:18634 stop:19959 length:1326 start_codon:yes stop_codon:yes gene_type:complete
MKLVGSKLLLAMGYSLWFSAVFTILLWLTFPWDRVRDQIVVAAADSGANLLLDSVRATTSSVQAKGLTLNSKDPQTGPLMNLERVKVSSSSSGVIGAALELRSILTGSSPASGTETNRRILEALEELEIEVDLYGGEFELEAQSDGNVSRIKSDFSQIDLTDYRLSTRSVTANPKGKLRGGSDLTWHWEDAKKSSGSIDLVANGLLLEGLTVAGFGLPETSFDRSEAHLKVSRGRAEFRDTSFESEVLQFAVEGYINLNTEISRSRLALRFRFKVRDDLDGLLKVQFGSNPRHKDDRGWYHYQVNGTLQRPRLRESPAAAKRGKKRTKPRPAAPPKSKEDPEPSAEEEEPEEELREARQKELDEERERLREERAKRREERKKKREDLIRKRNEKQAQLDSDENLRPATDDSQPEEEEPLRSNNPEEEEAEEEEEEAEEEVE